MKWYPEFGLPKAESGEKWYPEFGLPREDVSMYCELCGDPVSESEMVKWKDGTVAHRVCAEIAEEPIEFGQGYQDAPDVWMEAMGD